MKKILLIILSFTTFNLFAQEYQISFGSFNLNAHINNNHNFTYTLYYRDKQFINESSLGFELSKPLTQLTQFTLLGIDSSEVESKWKPIWGEQDEIENNYKQIIFHLKSINSNAILIDVQFRLFKDGLGFRYMFPEQNNLQYFIVKDELTQFHLNGNHKAFWIPGDFDTNEYMYTTSKLSEINAVEVAAKEKDIAVTSLIGNQSVQTPLMMKSDDGLYINIHEAALLNYPAMNLTLDKSNFSFTSSLVPDPVGNWGFSAEQH